MTRCSYCSYRYAESETPESYRHTIRREFVTGNPPMFLFAGIFLVAVITGIFLLKF